MIMVYHSNEISYDIVDASQGLTYNTMYWIC